MYDSEGTSSAPFSFDEMADHLLEQGAAASPSQVHGCLSGLLAAGADARGEFGLDALSRALDMAAHGDLADQIMRLYRVTAQAMADEDFIYNLLLPDDEAEMEVRVSALAAWCSGFLAGVAYASAADSDGSKAWSSDAREILEDIAAVSQAAVGVDETEQESEANYMELVEYLRFAVLNLVAENEAKANFTSLTRDPDEPLH
ncbi:MAG: UPF0149 family protein [Halioglobus sp.]|nr:UPF0149 family protein [Halioglobus sp.]